MNPPNSNFLKAIFKSMEFAMSDMNVDEIVNFHQLLTAVVQQAINQKNSLTKSEKPILSVVKSEE